MDAEREVTTVEARRDLRHLLNSVEHEKVHVRIKRYDTPTAVIVPVDWYEQAKALIAATEKERPR